MNFKHKPIKKAVSAALAAVMTIGLFPFSVDFEVYAEEDPYVELSQTLTAQDTFAWTEYDHDNYADRYAPSIPDHIIYDGDNIKMVGYGYYAFKDFLLINDTENKNSKKTFSFKIKRDGSDWHSMEGGGFLFNSSVKNNVLSGFCVLVTQSGLKLVQITGADVDKFRNGSYSNVQNAGKLLKTYSLSNLYGEHDLKIEVNNTSVSVWDGANVIIDGYTLPENNYGYGYGPITSHISHSCKQQSYFTFNDISMEEVVIHYIPKKPVDLQYTVNDDSSVTLSWAQPNGKADVAGYNIYRDDVQIGTSSETTYTDKVKAGNYSYYVSAFDTEDYTSDNSDSIEVDNKPLGVDEDFTIEETFNGKKYQLFDKHMKWSEAKEYCEQIGGHLITITSAEEEAFMEDLIRKGQNVMYWMGGKYDFNKSKWEWITGEGFTYSNWDYGEPNNYRRYTDGERESCAMIYKQPNPGVRLSQAYKWNDSYDDGNLPGQEDFFFTDNFGFVCEFEDKPEIPQNVTLSRTDKGIAVNWDIAGGNTAGYIVYKKGVDGEFEPVSDVLTENHFEDIFDCVNGVYTYAVAAKDTFEVIGELSKESSLKINLSSVPAPADITTDISGSRIEIKWAAPESDDVAYFRVYRKTTGGDYTLIKDNYKYLNYYDTDIELGTEYTYCVTAVDKNGNESVKSEAVTGGVTNDNVKPEILSVYPENGAVLDTNQVVGISARDNFRLDSITVECRPENGEWTTVFEENNINIYAKAVQFELDTSAFTTGRYEIRVYAKDKAGNISEYSDNSYTFKECALSAPVLTAVGEGWRSELSWTMENTEDLLGYHIYRKTSENGKYSCIASIKGSKYTDSDLTPDKTYYYMVEAVDSRNNTVKSGEVTSIPTNNDDIIPLADAGADTMGIAGEAISFNGSNSWDNHYVASYEWDFGDGKTAEGARVSHSFENDGTYDVTLTVKDSAGNSDSHTVKAYVYSNEYGTVQFKTVLKGTNTSIGNVKVYCDIADVDSSEFMTDANGNFKFIAPKGTYDVYFYKNEYLPQRASVKVTGETSTLTVEIEKKDLVEGELTVRPLDINEMIALGIDVNAPENQFVYEYEIDYGKDGKLNFTLNSTGDIIGEVNGTIQKERNGVYTEVQSISGSKDRPNRTEHGGYEHGSGGIPVSVAIFNVSTNVSWLKEFYDVDLTIINNADDDFSIQNSKAVLNLPKGLSLADTDRKESLTQIMGNKGVIGSKETEHASWIVRGDKAGSYDLSAEFTGVLMPLNEDVKVIFKTDEPLIVHDGTGLKLDITVTEGLDYWTNSFTFTNNSERDIYNFAASFSGSAQLSEFSAMYIEYPDGTIEIAEINKGVPDLENSDIFLPALIDDENQSIYDHRTVKPGQTVTGYFSIYRRDGFTNDD